MKFRGSSALILLFFCVGLSQAQADERVRRNFEVEWEAIEGASSYEVKLNRKDEPDKKPTLFKTKDTRWAATIKPGNYLMSIRSFDDRGAPGDWSTPSELQVKLPSVVQDFPRGGTVIQASDEDWEKIKLQWGAVPGAEKYKVSVKSVTGNWQAEKEVSDPYWEVKVPVAAALEWNVAAIDATGDTGDLNEKPIPFEVKGPTLTRPKIEKPLSKYVRDIEWAAPSKATRYAYELSQKNPKTKKWEKIDGDDSLTINKVEWDITRPSGKYRIKVQAFADRREPSKVVTMDFETRGGFRDPAALETAILRDSIVKPTNFYAIASYLYTNIQYSAVSYDEHQSSSFGASGGTGRIGLGYQDIESNWGGFGIGDLSGFTVGGRTFTFSSVEGHTTRKLEFGQGGLLLLGTGLYYKEMPAVKGNATDGFNGLGKVSQLGPHFGFTYWIPLSQRYGLQTNMRAYYSLLGKAFNGGAPHGALSYQIGLLGTYRISQHWMGHLGYAYRHDKAEFAVAPGVNSFATSGQVNSVEIIGHYINLLLEFSF